MAVPPRIRLVVLFGGRSAEHDVSCISARHVLAAADPERYSLEPIGIRRDGSWVRADEARAALERGVAELPESLVAAGPDVDPLPVLASQQDQQIVVLPILHGPMGEDGTVQGLLDLADVPYVGAGVLGSALAMDKLKAKDIMAAHGIAQARFVGLHVSEIHETTAADLLADLGSPVFVKPANMGSSVGVSKAATADDVRTALDLACTYDEWLVVEEGILGREIEVSVLGNNTPRASVPGEIVPAADFYSYADKYLDGKSELIVPAPLADDVVDHVRRTAVQAFRALRIEGLARVDFFWEEDGRGLLLNEVNTMPGFTPISMYPRLWEASGLPYAKLIDELVSLAIERHERRRNYRRTDH